ncbi:hypothetical protein D3C85_1063380 [compost metagenome]
MPARRDFERAGAGDVDVGVEDVAARGDHRHVGGLLVDDEVAARTHVRELGRNLPPERARRIASVDDVPAGLDPDRAGGLVPGRAAVGQGQGFASAQADNVTAGRIEANGRCCHVAGQRLRCRVRAEGKQRSPVESPSEHRRTHGRDVGDTNFADELVFEKSNECGIERRRQRRAGARHAHAELARVDRTARQHLEFAACERRQGQPVAQCHGVVPCLRQRRVAGVDVPRQRGGVKDARIDDPCVG